MAREQIQQGEYWDCGGVDWDLYGSSRELEDVWDEVREVEGSLEGMIKLTIDYPSNHMGGGSPDFRHGSSWWQIWRINKGVILDKFSQKMWDSGYIYMNRRWGGRLPFYRPLSRRWNGDKEQKEKLNFWRRKKDKLWRRRWGGARDDRMPIMLVPYIVNGGLVMKFKESANRVWSGGSLYWGDRVPFVEPTGETGSIQGRRLWEEGVFSKWGHKIEITIRPYWWNGPLYLI